MIINRTPLPWAPILFQDTRIKIQLTPNNSNLQGKLKKFRVIKGKKKMT